MPNNLCIAGAGSGKTHKVITESIAEIKLGGKVLVVTYTTSNQQELRSRFLKEFGENSDRFVVKGLFSFYLEDLIRPYQRAIFEERIEGILFNESNPHLNPKTRRPISGRQEMLAEKKLNAAHYLSTSRTKAHTGFLAKLATRIAERTGNASATRLSEIYTRIFFDEVQDLVGWDYSVLKNVSKIMKSSITCVGDFRQTVYETTFGHKDPQTAAQKIDQFNAMGFKEEPLSHNRRCIQSICDIADTVHEGFYEATISAVEHIPENLSHHLGAFIIKHSEVAAYISKFDPMVLRWNINSGTKFLPDHARCYNFGSSKGLGFDRVLILPAESQINFVLDRANRFAEGSEISQNKLYVAITRARYSLGFVVPDKLAQGLRFPLWANQ